MSIGETLARARQKAGLSITELSIRTRITQSVIDGIEHDDYSADNGDSPCRADIAAIARALGVDSGPLLDAFDAGEQPGEWVVAVPRPEPGTAAQEPEQVPWVPRPVPADDDTQPLTNQDLGPLLAGEPTGPSSAGPLPAGPLPAGPLPAGELPDPFPAQESLDPPATGELADPFLAGEPADPFLAGEPADPLPAGSLSRPSFVPRDQLPRRRRPYADRRKSFWLVLGAGLAVVAAFGGILFLLGTSGQSPRHAVAGGQRSDAKPGHSASPAERTQPAAHGASQHVRTLAPASIAAFGPGGAGQGDSPQLAHQALAGKPDAPWHSSWYTTANFGNLQSGTGLLLDMGRPVTITSVRIALGAIRGANLTLRIGNAPTMASLRPAAHARGAGGLVRLTTAPTKGRYVLVWFTRLPPDHAGTFQVLVHDIMLRGYR